MSYGRRNGYGPDFGGPKSVEIGKEYDVKSQKEVTGVGDGIARRQGFVVFIKNGKVGETLRLRLLL